MTSTLPADPYKALGVSKDAKLAEIRSAHRKLVLKCHPDKVQDAALKAVKQDEFQKVQEAYEILSDETRRVQYDEQFKLHELRKEMGRGNPTPRSNPFEYEIRTAEPPSSRPGSYSRSKPSPPMPSAQKVYSTTPPRSYENVIYAEPRTMPRKQTSYDSADRRRGSTREEEKKKYEEEERARRFEKESKRSSHGKDRKSRDKERRRGTEEKHSRTTAAYIESDDSDDYRPAPRSSEKKSSRHKEEPRHREEPERPHTAIKATPLDPKWNQHMDFAGKYMQAARRKVAPADDEAFHPGPPRRAETYTAPTATYNVRHVAPPQQYSDEETPKRSSAQRRSSDATPNRTRDKSSKGTRKSPTPPAHSREPYIVDAPAPAPTAPPRKPSLQTHTSAPAGFASAREMPMRSKTQDFSRPETIPSLPRAHTFQAGERSRDHGGSRLKNPVEYNSDSDSEPTVQPHRRSQSPRRAEPTRYIIDKGRSIPVSKHRSELHNIDGDHSYTRERSESPRGGQRSREQRPPVARNPNSSERIHATSQRGAYYAPEPPEPIKESRSKMSPREGAYRTTSSRAAPYFSEVKYAPSYRVEDVQYSSSPAGIYRSGSDPSSQARDPYYSYHRGGGREVST